MINNSKRPNKIRVILSLISCVFGLILTVPVMLAGVPFWVVAWATRYLARRIEPKIMPWQSIVNYDPLLGWKPKANVDVYCCTEEVFRVTTGEDGWRGSSRIGESDILVIGDSFAFGYGVNDAEMFSAVVANARVKAIGAPGYNLVQELLVLRQLSTELAGKLIVWFIFLGNDLVDNLYPYMQIYRTPFLRQVNNNGQWRIEASHLSPKTRSYRFGQTHEQVNRERLADLCSATYLAERAYSACEFLIAQGQQHCQAQGARLCIFTIPDPAQLSAEGQKNLRESSSAGESFDAKLPDRKISEICARLGVAFVAGQEHLMRNEYRAVDRHWTPQGHRKVAAVLEKLNRGEARLASVGM